MDIYQWNIKDEELWVRWNSWCLKIVCRTFYTQGSGANRKEGPKTASNSWHWALNGGVHRPCKPSFFPFLPTDCISINSQTTTFSKCESIEELSYQMILNGKRKWYGISAVIISMKYLSFFLSGIDCYGGRDIIIFLNSM
jgi:hypothetical protein